MRTPKRPCVTVLLAVYQGARFLSQQIDSILQQSGVDVRLYCRDDGSTDASPAILDAWARRVPEQVRLVDSGERLGPAGSFQALMQQALTHSVAAQSAGAENPCTGYFALADQDDLWHPEKLRRGHQRLRQAERALPNAPVLVHSDLRVVDAAGRLIASSLACYQRIPQRRAGFEQQLLRNTVTGCTVLMNAALLRKALPIPEAVIMHDWWLSLVASAFGQICYIDQPLVDYRQHAGNVLGARALRRHDQVARVLGRLVRGQPLRDNRVMLSRLAAQAAAFSTRFESELSLRQRQVLARLIALPEGGWWRQLLWDTPLRSWL